MNWLLGKECLQLLTQRRDSKVGGSEVQAKGPSINDVELQRGRGVAKYMTIVLIGCVSGTVKRGGGGVQKCGKYA